MDQSGDTKKLLELHQNSYQYDYRRAALWYYVQKIIPEKSKVLDAGCGSGYISYKIAQRGNTVVALEYDPVLINFVKKKFKQNNLSIRAKKFILGEKGKDIKIGKYDYIVCLDVLEHIKSDIYALKELKSALKKNGKIIISVPAMPILYGKRDKNLGHHRRYSKKDLQNLIKKAGLSVVEIRYWNFLGALIYFFFEKILSRPIWDSLRRPSYNIIARFIRHILIQILKMELRFKVPFGLTLLAICK